MSILQLMAAPFAECMVLVGIHTYLGVHVLRRRVIFVDLALAQIAALGTTVGFFFGILPETSAALVFSMLFTFVGAGVFAVTRIRSERVPQEAIIGLVYDVLESGVYADDCADFIYHLPYPKAGSRALLARIDYLLTKHSIDILFPTLDSEIHGLLRLEEPLFDRGIKMLLGNDAPGRPPGLHRLELLIARDAAAYFVENVT